MIPFRRQDAKRVGEGLLLPRPDRLTERRPDQLGEGVGFNYGCYVNGYGGLRIGDRTILGPTR
jgi:hypothetical protein